ncbi:MAG: hypothetical protein FJ265_14460 [Planctomycetes bacterium]|nr:hypothetical protein [Planctomycetota bacterium]
MVRPFLAVAALLPFLLAVPGCVLAAAAVVGAAAVGAVSYENNEAWMDFRDSLPVTWAATVRGMRQLGHVIPGDPQPGATEGRLEVDQARVVVEAHPGGFVRVRARVGTFDTKDNERRAKLILEEVTRQMPPR